MTCREFRQQYNYTLTDLSNETGYSVSAISKWERECETMPQDFVDKIYNKFGILIEKQTRYYVFKKEHNNTILELQKEIDDLNKRIDKLIVENIKLKIKIKKIQKICEE